jgi:hypothetical protein
LCLKAFKLNPNPKYAYTLAFYMRENKNPKRAAEMLKLVIENWPLYVDAYMLLKIPTGRCSPGPTTVFCEH